MSDLTVQRVFEASEELIEDAVQLTVDAMAGDAAMYAFCGGDMSIHPHLARAMVIEGIRWGELWTAMEGDELVGYMTWFPPHTELAIPKEERAAVNAPFLNRLSEEGKAYTKNAMGPEFTSFVARCIGDTGKHDGWWLRVAMVRPGKQGQGVARKLFEPVRRKIAERGEHIALSTTSHRNVAIYKRLGFGLRGFRMMPCQWGDWALYVFYQKP
ncbi:hypothetical protein BD413DRAFT_489531 [Trametes elegans]|nr:hypothetical protein BD413DRAFT_489531 [Trametes elegans]